MYNYKIPEIEGYNKKQIISFVKRQLLVNEEWRLRAFQRLFQWQKPLEKYNYLTAKAKPSEISKHCPNKECISYNQKFPIDVSICPDCKSNMKTRMPEPCGFDKADALKMTTLYKKSLPGTNDGLTKDDKKYLKIKIPRYAAQIASKSNPIILKKHLDEFFGK